MKIKVKEAQDVEFQGVKHHYNVPDDKLWKRYELRKKFTSD